MKKILTWCQLLITVMLLASCNLFIDDDVVNEEGFKNVPEHTGEAYDAPVTTKQEGLDVTYQYKKDVRVLDKADADRYVTDVQYDAVGAFIEIHFRRDTPADVLPVNGEILMTTVSEHFKWGACHRIQYRVDEDGVYKYIGSFASIKEAFENLQIDGQLEFEKEREYYVEPDVLPYDEEEGDEPADEEALARRKLEQTILPNVKVVVNEDGFGFEFATPITFETNAKGVYMKLDMPAEKNTYRTQDKLDFSDWNFSEGQLKFHYRQTIHEKSELKIQGGYHLKKKKLWSASPMMEVLPVGPVVLLIWVDVDLSLTVDIDVTTTLDKERKVIYDYDIDLWEQTMTKKTTIVEDTGWKWTDFQASCVVTLELSFTIGIGLYGKVISVRLIPAFTGTFTVATSKMVKDSRGNWMADLTERPGPELKFEFAVKLGVFLDLSLRELVGGFKEVGTAEQKQLLKDLEANAEQTSQYYKDIVEGDKSKDDSDIGLYTTFGPYTIGTKQMGSWYPTIDDKSLTVEKLWNANTTTMSFVGAYQIKSVGINATMFFRKYVPAVCLKLDNKVVDYYFSEEAGFSQTVTADKIYHFSLPTMTDDKQYTISPCYFVMDDLEAPVAIDKALPYNATSPRVSIVTIKPTSVKRVVNSERFAGEPKYTYTFCFDTYTEAKGMEYISSWGLREQFDPAINHEYNKSSDKKQKDKTVLMHWKITQRSDSETHSIVLSLFPYYNVRGTALQGSAVGFAMSSNHEYSVTVDGNTEEGTF